MAANSCHQQKQKPQQNNHGNKVVPKQQCNTQPSSRRTPSFSSSSSSSIESSSFCYFHDDHNKILLSPASPLRFSGGVPFSWEHLPGIPKKQSSKRIPSSPSSMKLLPLMPPPTKHGTHDNQEASRVRKKNSSFQKDPFLAALVECSKEDQDEETRSRNRNLWSGPKVSRSISDRFGFTDIYGSCKRTCAVSESIVYLPSSSSSSSSSSRRSTTTTYAHVSRRRTL